MEGLKTLIENGVLVQKGASILITVIAALIALKIGNKVLDRVLEKSKLDRSAYTFIRHLVKIVLWMVVILSILSQLGVNISSVLTVFAAMGAAVALAVKDSLSNVAGGLIIMFNKPFKSGDYITCGSNSGIVDSIDLMSTTIHTMDNKVIIIPNGSITSASITNFSKMEDRRVDVYINVSYDSDIELAKQIMIGLVKDDPRVFKDPAPYCIVTGYEESHIVLSLRAWVKNPDYWWVYGDVMAKIKTAFDENGVRIPYPQMDVHLKEK